ncbi:putative membrane protein, partial [Vibrio parahaemolyticus AQ3810]
SATITTFLSFCCVFAAL